MIDRAISASYIITPFAQLRVSKSTAEAMDKVYPGWDGAWIDERTREGKRAQEGQNKLIEVANFVAELNWHIGADISEL